jgi:hypothetical protein
VEAVVAAAVEAIARRDWEGLKPLLHPYLHWHGAGGARLRGRTNVLAHLESAGLQDPPAEVELRDGQIYRWRA